MTARRDRLNLLIASLLAIGIHGLLLLPWMVAIMASPRLAMGEISSTLDPEPTHDREIDLGIEAETPSSLTWIGYEEYEEHLAALSEFDQAITDDDPPQGARPTKPTQPAIEQPVAASVAKPDAGSESEVELPIPDPSATESTEAAPLFIIAEDAEAVVSDSEVEPDTAPVIERPAEDDAEKPEPDPADDPEPTEADSGQAEETETDTAEDQPGTEPAEPAQPSPPAPATPPGETEEPTESETEATDSESDAASTINVPPENWKSGKPLAAHGLTLKPRKPQFTTLVLVTASPLNPLCRMEFDHRGIVVDAEILKSSGDSRVDKAIMDALYGWRAQGEQLGALEEGQTVEITMRFVLREGKDAE